MGCELLVLAQAVSQHSCDSCVPRSVPLLQRRCFRGSDKQVRLIFIYHLIKSNLFQIFYFNFFSSYKRLVIDLSMIRVVFHCFIAPRQFDQSVKKTQFLKTYIYFVAVRCRALSACVLCALIGSTLKYFKRINRFSCIASD